MSEDTTTEGQTDAGITVQPPADGQAQVADQSQPVADGAAAPEAAKVEPEGAAPSAPAAPKATQPPVAPTEPPAPPAPDVPVVAAKPGKKGKTTVRTEVKKPVVDVVTAETKTKTDVEDTEVDELPAKITLAAPYAFYDDDGELQSWLAGSVVEDPDTIALLIGRGAIIKAE